MIHFYSTVIPYANKLHRKGFLKLRQGSLTLSAQEASSPCLLVQGFHGSCPNDG
jgi:hypothetical protein